MRPTVFAWVAMLCLMVSTASGQLASGWKAHDLSRSAPVVVTPSEKVGGPPSDAVVLFDGTDMSKWRSSAGGDARWKIVDGAMESVPSSGFVYSEEKFGDCQVHLEFASPVKVQGKGQGRGNSGVFLMGSFEVQVLDSYENSTYSDGSAASIYGQYPPLVNASKKPGEWQSYDIIYRRPKFDDTGKLATPAKITVLHNGVLVQDSSEPYGPTSWIQHYAYDSIKNKKEGPLSLQDHGNPVRYRNIWVRRLAESRPQPKQPYDPEVVELDQVDADLLVGKYGPHEVVSKDGKLTLMFRQNTPLELIPHSKTEFGFTKSAGKVSFQTDDQGKPTALTLQLDAAGTSKAERSDD